MKNGEAGEQQSIQAGIPGTFAVQRSGVGVFAARIVMLAGLLLVAAIAFVVYEHFKLNVESTPSLASLAAYV